MLRVVGFPKELPPMKAVPHHGKDEVSVLRKSSRLLSAIFVRPLLGIELQQGELEQI